MFSFTEEKIAVRMKRYERQIAPGKGNLALKGVCSVRKRKNQKTGYPLLLSDGRKTDSR